jgi:hypothetical protein
MVKAVIISAVAGFSLPYFMDISIPGIPPRQIIPLPIETGIRSPSNSARDTIFSSQVVNRSKKGDKLEILHTSQRPIDQERDTVQKTITPDSKIKIGCEQPFSDAVRNSVIVGRCLADSERLYRAAS